jgi:hypothetical protein
MSGRKIARSAPQLDGNRPRRHLVPGDIVKFSDRSGTILRSRCDSHASRVDFATNGSAMLVIARRRSRDRRWDDLFVLDSSGQMGWTDCWVAHFQLELVG